ncbi:MAG: peptidylprolyl isomerase [Chloroflexi bacterium]|nr:peptidylprolyl isomerase [Chloroflexota bacterium]
MRLGAWLNALAVACACLALVACGTSASAASVSIDTAAEKAACGGQLPPSSPERNFTAPPPMTIDTSKSYTAIVETQYGTIIIELLPKAAPQTVNNFVFLACHGFYDGLTFHRIVPGFVIQGGDPQGTGAGGPGYTFPDELPSSAKVYTLGAVAMANSGPNTNGSQFFICVANDSGQLQPLYSYFGKVTSGFQALKRITQVPLTTGSDGQKSKPVTPVVIEHVIIQEH